MIRASTFSAAGGHPINEDASLVRELSPDAWLIVLADGQGGRAGGARAAQLACQTAVEHATRAASCDWREVLSAADAAVASDRDAGFTTLVGLSVRAGRVAGASCGDSAAVAVCGDTAPKVLTSRQFKNPPVGSGEATFVPFELKLAEPWKLLVVSDGVWKYSGWDRVWSSLARLSGEELLDDLKAAARLPATGEFPDDFTAVLLEGGGAE
jgi:hypothetical protein